MYSGVHPQLNRCSTNTTTKPKDQEEDQEVAERLRQECLLISPLETSSTSGNFHCHLNTLLFGFFNTTRQASIACACLLSSIPRARSHHRSLCHALSSAAFSLLSPHLDLDNPLSPKTLAHFHLIHSHFPTLIRRLTSAYRKISRRLKLIRYAKKAACAAGIAILGWSELEKARARVDAATRGAYIVGRDLDTMSRMVRRVHDEVEHGRDVARMVVRSGEWGMVREVVKEMEGRGLGLGFEEKLKELEEHVYLCLITISRSRRLVAEEMEEEEV